jgi:O-antigen/teichoic acid export membrane protein
MASPDTTGPDETGATLARGGRTNFFGFLLRLAARLPFLFIAGRLYGAESLGRFAYATMVVEFAAALALVGLKRGLAGEMAREDLGAPVARAGARDGHVLMDAAFTTLLLAAGATLVLALLPGLMFPGPEAPDLPLFALMVPLIVLSDLTLAGLAYRNDFASQVRARSVVEPWTLTIVGTAVGFTLLKEEGLLIAYAASMAAACAWSLWPAWRMFGWPQGWRPSFSRARRMARANVALLGADLVEWGSRRLDIFILGRFASAEVVGIYYVAQQLATLPQKLRTTFDPVLAPLLSRALRADRRAEAAGHIRQAGFWVLAFQLALVLWLSVFGVGWMGLFGPAFVIGASWMILLVLTEVAAAQGGLAEAALVYARPRWNLSAGLAALAFQGGLTVLLAPRFGGLGAAAALFAAVGLLAVWKSVLLGRYLGTSVSTWRWSLLWAVVPALAVGFAALALLPEWAELAFGAPATLLVFGLVIWRVGFQPADRMLFRRMPRP